MEKRPELNQALKATVFREFYYLKEELVYFCRANNLPTSGSKIELTNRIAYFLETGIIAHPLRKRKQRTIRVDLSEDSIIEEHFVCSEYHRSFFKDKVGKSFSFNVAFQKWLKNNGGKTYKDALDAYYEIMEKKKNTKTTIDRQFEYNTYIRDFF